MEKKIDLMIIGAQKAGTTSLLRYLGEHPQCVSHPQKEFAYFLDSKEYENNYKKAFTKYYSEQAIFPECVLIAKSASLYTNEVSIKRLYDHNPKCELILLLRNPTERAYSSFLMEKNAGSVDFEFPEIKNILHQPSRWEYDIFINFGIYVNHLKNIYKYFPEEQVTILLYEDFKNDSAAVCKNIFSKLKISNNFIPNIEIKHNITKRRISTKYAKTITKILHKDSFLRKCLNPIIPSHKAYKYGNILRDVNKTNDQYPEMEPNTRKTLSDFYTSHNKELSKIIGKDLSNWDCQNKIVNTKKNNNELRYRFIYLSNCNMCGNPVEQNKIIGQRFNQSQGKNPKSKIGITTSILKCSKCNLIYSNPQPIPLNIQDHYGVPPESYWEPSYFQVQESYFQGELEVLKTLLPPDHWQRALDIGAGLGKTMISLNKVGFDAFGLEPSKPFYERAISIMKIRPDRLSLGMIEELDYPENHFDFITFGAVLEHLYSPSAAIEKAMKWVKPGGIVHIEVPSSKWLINRIANQYYKKIALSNYVANLSPMHPPYHLYEFDIASFLENSRINNFEIAHHEYYVCDTYMPKFLDFILKPMMKRNNSGMQLCVWLRKTS